ncbi:unnamed protein product [Sphagnum balticum]
MCEAKLKAKLVQAISDTKNEKRIRERMADPEGTEKVQLLDESLIVDEFYSGGPEETPHEISNQAISTICEVIKAQFYEKSIRETLESIDINNLELTRRTQRSGTAKATSICDIEKRGKSRGELKEKESRFEIKEKESRGEEAEAIIKQKIIDNKERTSGLS